MRTTLDIDEDVLIIAKDMAARQRISVGAALSTLAREALRRPVEIRREGRVPVFDVPDEARSITNEMVRAALNEP